MNNIEFRKTIKTLFSDQTWSSEKITLVAGDKVLTQDAKNAEVWITFSSNPIKNMKIPKFEEVNPFAEKLSYLILKAIFKYITPKYPIIIAINHVSNG